jgi:uncharacterized protein (DUF1800 family)
MVSPSFAIDRNGNGMCDVWEARYAVGALDPDGDADGNGMSNRLESIAGTNPFAAQSDFRIRSITMNPGAVVRVPSVPGKRYRLFSAATPAGPWTPAGDAVEATAEEMQFPAQAVAGSRAFFRVEVSDVDSDGDGLSNWAERQVEGLNPANGDSFSAGVANADLAFVQSWLDQLGNGALQMASSAADAFEKEASPAAFTFTRTSPITQPFTLFLRNSPPTSQGTGIAGAGDFVVKNASGVVLHDRLVIPAGQASASVFLHPVTDALAEVPEEVRYKIGGTSLELAGRICDAQPTEQNVKLLVAYLSPRQGVVTQGSGMAAVRLAGDNASAIVTVNFSNLTSLTSSAHIETPNSSIMLSVPPFRYNGQPWEIKANQHFTNDQQVLDALLSGSFQFNVYTEMAASGEIAGAFQSVNGSTVFHQPPAAAAIAPLTGEALDREIVRFLTQSTFGATWEDVLAMRARITNHNGNRIAAFSEWIDEQFALPAPSHQQMTAAGNALEKSVAPTASLNQTARQTAWWTIALHSPDQLRQRMTFALSQILVISDEEPTIERMGVGMANYYDMLQSRAFGTYRSTLEDVTLHTNMGQYLSHLRNQKTQVTGGVVVASPDENFAREIMQLFSIGLVQLHPDGSLILGADGLPIPTYDQEDITQLAKVFTGWSFSKKAQSTNSTVVLDNNDFFLGSGYEEYAIRWSHPMKLFAAYHDETAKSFLGQTIPARVGGGTQDLANTLDLLTNHPNTAPFICRQLIQRFTTATPSAGYIHRVASAFSASGGNLGTTLKSILLDPDARNSANANTAVSFGKSKEMLIRHAMVLRALQAKSAIPIALFQNFGYPASETAKFPATARIARYRNTSASLSQTPLGAPSVFNWYRPDYAPAGSLSQNGVFSPEFQIVNENTVVRGINYHYEVIKSTTGQSVTTLPTGLDITGVAGFSSYNNNSDNMIPDLSPYRALYLSVLDTNLDGAFSNADTTWANRVAKIAEAVELVVDRADLLLCAGSLKARYGNTRGQPRRIILDAVNAVESQDNNATTATSQTESMNERIVAALDLIIKSPDFIIQK